MPIVTGMAAHPEFTRYRGRFAPSPTGPLHFGSLVAAVASWCDARAAGGEWLVRIEDVDTPRSVPGAADAILHTLERFGLAWDGAVERQSARTPLYRAAFEQLLRDGHVYGCACTRREIADSALAGVEGPVYPGTCRGGLPGGRTARAHRVRVPASPIAFDDRVQGPIEQDLAREVGDFVVLRADGLFAYQLAVVVDDDEQGITHVVRGADLLASTPRQIHLMRLLGHAEPAWMHVPVVVDARGEKLSKQTHAPSIDAGSASTWLERALSFLGHAPPADAHGAGARRLLEWAVTAWHVGRIPRLRARPAGD